MCVGIYAHVNVYMYIMNACMCMNMHVCTYNVYALMCGGGQGGSTNNKAVRQNGCLLYYSYTLSYNNFKIYFQVKNELF